MREFLSTETAGATLLLCAALVALVWANAPFGDTYLDFWATRITLDLDFVTLDLTLVEWINDGLMAIFFFVVGLEIKREVLRGELADPRKAALPAIAAIGGMAVPALLFLAFNAGGEGERGWGIPMATDIAFAVGVLTLLGTRVPLSLKVFLLALAIVDDLGAILVIAVFYTDDLDLTWLAIAAAMLALTVALGRLGVRHLAVYAAIGVVAWLAVHESGVHATVAGVLLALLCPTEVRDSEELSRERGPLLYRLEHALHPWTSFVIVPAFALANAGVELDSSSISDAFASRVSWGVVAGLVLGKPLGITLFSMVAVRVGVASLPAGIAWGQLVAVSAVAGIGFTVSLFIANLAFSDATMIADAKIAIVGASTAMGLAGYALLSYFAPTTRSVAGARDEPYIEPEA